MSFNVMCVGFCSVEKDVLFAKGQASQDWIVEAQALARVLPGITRFDVGELQNSDLLVFKQMDLLFQSKSTGIIILDQ